VQVLCGYAIFKDILLLVFLLFEKLEWQELALTGPEALFSLR